MNRVTYICRNSMMYFFLLFITAFIRPFSYKSGTYLQVQKTTAKCWFH